MKTVFTLLTCLIFYSKSNAQDFDYLLGKPSDVVISNQNVIFNFLEKDKSTQLIEAHTWESRGFYLSFQNRVFYDNVDHYSYNKYFFDKQNNLEAASEIFSATDELEQVNKMLSNGWYKITEHVLYNRIKDLKVTLYNSSTANTDQVIFLYTRKSYKTPD